MSREGTGAPARWSGKAVPVVTLVAEVHRCMRRQVPRRGHCIHARAVPFHLPVSLISGREDLQILTTAHRGRRRRMSWLEPGEHMALSRTRMLPNGHLIHKYLIECSRQIGERVLLLPKLVCT